MHFNDKSHNSSVDTSASHSDPRQPRRLPQEWPAGQERYTEEITASNRAYHSQAIVSLDHIELVDEPTDRPAAYIDPSQTDFSRNAAELTEAESSPDPGPAYSERAAKQTSDYHEGDKAAPNNNLFFEERSNPLSSKGN